MAGMKILVSGCARYYIWQGIVIDICDRNFFLTTI